MVRDFFYYNPVKIVFGEGKLAEAGQYAQVYGKKAAIVTTGHLFKENGLVERLQKVLLDSGVESIHYGEVSANPLNTQIDKGAAAAKAAGCDMVIGLGGGSAIDAAKGMAIVLGHDRPIWDFCIGDDVQPITEKTFPSSPSRPHPGPAANAPSGRSSPTPRPARSPASAATTPSPKWRSWIRRSWPVCRPESPHPPDSTRWHMRSKPTRPNWKPRSPTCTASRRYAWSAGTCDGPSRTARTGRRATGWLSPILSRGCPSRSAS